MVVRRTVGRQMGSKLLKGEIMSLKSRGSVKSNSVVVMEVLAEDGITYKVIGNLRKGAALGKEVTFNYNSAIGVGGETRLSRKRSVRHQKY